jgi:hypothetical protein
VGLSTFGDQPEVILIDWPRSIGKGNANRVDSEMGAARGLVQMGSKKLNLGMTGDRSLLIGHVYSVVLPAGQ